MELIKPSEISGRIMTLIEEADEKLVLVSPYYNISKWDKLLHRLTELKRKNISVEIYVREHEAQSIQEILKQGFKYSAIPNLHTKLYFNEKQAIVSSMNLNQSSDTNSLDIGLVNETTEEYEMLVNYYERYIRKYNTGEKSFDTGRLAKENIRNAGSYKSTVTSSFIGEKKVTQEDFSTEWYKWVKRNHPKASYTEKEGILYATDFVSKGIHFSTEYGFTTLKISVSKDQGEALKDLHYQHLVRALSSYRIYWNSPFDKLTLYHAKDIHFKSLGDEVKYCAEGVDILVSCLKKARIFY
jgi:hypothetical protein